MHTYDQQHIVANISSGLLFVVDGSAVERYDEATKELIRVVGFLF